MTPLNPAFALIPLVSAVVVVALSVAARRDPRAAGLRVGRRETAWSWVFAALLALMAALVRLGLFGAGAGVLVAHSLLTIGFSLVSLAGNAIRARVGSVLERVGLGARTRRVVATLLVLLAATALATLALERPYNDGAYVIGLPYNLVEGGMVALVLLTLLLLSQGTGVGPAVGTLALFCVGVAQFYVKTFKNAAILPGDLFVLGTAAAVSGGYSYVFSAPVVWGLVFAEGGVCLLSLLRPPRRQHRGRSVAAHLAGAAACLAALAAVLVLPPYQSLFGVTTNGLFWYSMDYYQRQGFLTSFTMVAQAMPIEVPEGYSQEGAQDLEASYAEAYDDAHDEQDAAVEEQFAQEQPSVVVVMNETFSDLSTYGALAEDTGYEGPTYFKTGLTDAIAKGDLTVSVVGAGTCNTEFEFLTGTSLAYVGDGKYPYSLYDLSSAPSLARQFKELGYETTALHPNWETNWNRNKVYPALGFDTFLSYNTSTFDGDPWYHNGISDEATYDHVLDILRSSDSPQFVFDVTMQNHGGYDKGNIPWSDRTHYHASKLSYDDNAKLNEYLACINESDRALEEFIGELRELDRPVVVVFFGDHQPSIAPDINDAYYADDADDMEHAQRERKTSYLVWANYDVQGCEQVSEPVVASVDGLSALTLESVGGPLTDYEKAKLQARDDIEAMNTVGYEGADGLWYALDDGSSPYAGTFRDLAQITYLEFGSRV